MKKIIMAVAAVVIGVTANAASFKWTAANVYDSTGTAKFNGTALIYAVGFEDAIATATVSNGILGFTGDWTDAAPGNNYEFFFVIEDNGKTFTSSSKLAPAQATATQTVAFGNMMTATKNASNWSAVPEPTSAMLLVLGVAALALRRRRA